MTKLTIKYRLNVEGTSVSFQILEQAECLRRQHDSAPWLDRRVLPGDDYMTLDVSSLNYPELLVGEVYLRGAHRERDDDVVVLDFDHKTDAREYADKVRVTLHSLIACGGFQMAAPVSSDTDGDVTTLTLI